MKLKNRPSEEKKQKVCEQFDVLRIIYNANTYIRLTVPNQKVTVVSMRIEHSITLASRDCPIVPGFTSQIWTFDWIVRIIYQWRRW